MAYFKATIEVLVDVASEAEACDAISEAIRPMLQEFGADSAWVDWRYCDAASYPTPSNGAGFEYSTKQDQTE